MECVYLLDPLPTDRQKAEGSTLWMLSIKERRFINLYCQRLNSALMAPKACSRLPAFQTETHPAKFPLWKDNLSFSWLTLKSILKKANNMDFPGGPVVGIPLPTQGTQD